MQTRNTTSEDSIQVEYPGNRAEHTIFLSFVYVLGPAKKLPLIQVEVGDIPTVALCDTGASFSFMKKSFSETIKTKYESAKLDVIGAENVRLMSIDRKDIQIRGEIRERKTRREEISIRKT